MDNTQPETQPITAQRVPLEKRMEFLPRHFGMAKMIFAEQRIYNAMRSLCEDYTGGRWEFYDLSNGGFYMAPDVEGKLHLAWPGNWFSGDMSADAAGIVACLFAINSLLWDAPSEKLEHAYYALREFAYEHAEAQLILAAID